MDHFYVACELGAEYSRVLLGTLRKEQLIVSEVHRFASLPLEQNGSRCWNIPHLYAEMVRGIREIGTYEEFVSSLSCHARGGDYMIFDPDGSLNTPVRLHANPTPGQKIQDLIGKDLLDTVYEETGAICQPGSTLFELSTGKSRRVNQTGQILPIADGFNFLLSGTSRVEMSSACAMQLFNPFTGTWSERLLSAVRLPAKTFPDVIPAGTRLGLMQGVLAKDVKLDGVKIIATCSDECAATRAGLPVAEDESWAYLRTGVRTFMGTELSQPVVSEAARELHFSNWAGLAGAVGFEKEIVGLGMLDECERFWKSQNRDLDKDMLFHFAAESTPFASLVDLSDARFQTPEDMPLKIQAFCRETDQPVPRKPGAVIRCLLESLALLYRKTLEEIESLTGRKITKLYVLDGQENGLLNHFTANTLQIPVVVVPPGSGAAGNLLAQSMAQGHVKSREEGLAVLRSSIKIKTLAPHGSNWGEAYARLVLIGAARS